MLTHGSADGYSRVAELEAWGGGAAAAAQGADVRWLVADQLGTPRMVVDKTGSLAGVTRHDYLPFGEELYAEMGGRTTTQGYSAVDNIRQKFTEKERDRETALDYFNSRYYSSTMGRFTSPDSIGGRVTNPQTLNLYAYVLNNPLKWTDPTGHRAQDPQNTPTNDDPDWWNTEETAEVITITTSVPADKHPGFVVSLIPVIGSGLEARAYWHEGRYGWAALHAGLAVSDVFLVKSAATAGVKLGGKLLFKEAATEAAEVVVKDALIESGVHSGDTFVVRGGANLPESFAKGSGVTLDGEGLLKGVSVNSAPGVSVEELSKGIPHNQIGVTTVSEIEAAGGTVTPKPTKFNPYHCEMCGLTPEKASELFRPTIRNPHKP